MQHEKNGNHMHTVSEQVKDMKEKVSEWKESLEDAAAMGKKKARKFTRAAQATLAESEERVKKNPWLYIGAAAAGALAIGYLMGLSKRRK